MIKGMRMPDSRVRMIFLDAITDKDEDLIDMETFVDIVQQHGLKFKLQDTLEAQLMDNTVCGAKPCLAAFACMGRDDVLTFTVSNQLCVGVLRFAACHA